MGDGEACSGRSDPPTAGLLEVGRVDRAHGLAGEVVVHLLTDREERVAPGSLLHTHRGPLRVQASRPHQQRHLVRFEGIADRAAAQALAGRRLFAEPIDDPDTLWAHQLIGCRVRDTQGVDRGTVVALEHNPASDLLVLDTGALVPLRFLVEGPAPTTGPPPQQDVLVVDTPPGLFDL